MEIRRWHCYLIINCVLLIPCLVAKPFSLNEALAAESKQKRQLETTPRPNVAESAAEHFSLNKALNLDPLKTLKAKKYKTGNKETLRNKKISPLKYKRAFQIKPPLKPKKLKFQQRPWQKRKSQSLKREIYKNEKINKKYIPLLRNLGILFDNFISSDSVDSTEIIRNKIKRTRYNSEERNGVVCKCSRKTDSEIAESKTSKKAIATTAPVPDVTAVAETLSTETPTTTSDNTTAGHISSLGPHTKLSLLLARNTSSARRNNNGFSEGNSTAFHRSSEGDFTGDNRNSEYDTGSEQNDPDSTIYKEDPCSTPRNNASSDGQRGRICGDRNVTQSPVYRGESSEANQVSEDENTRGRSRGDIDEPKRENKLETGGDKTNGEKLVSKFVPGYRELSELKIKDKTNSDELVPKFTPGFRGLPEDKVSNNAEPIQSKEDHEESIDNVADHLASDQRLADGNGAITGKNKETSPANEAVITFKDLSNPILLLHQNNPTNKAPMVTIIDGYSVARDKNGANKMSESSIRIHN